jgi:hypothetical protein
VDEGTTAANDGTFSDVPADTVTISASVGSLTQTSSSTGTWNWSNPAPDGPDSYNVSITAADEDGGSSTTTFSVTVNNVAPTANAGLDLLGVLRNAIFSVTGTWTDAAEAADDLYSWSWDLDGDPTTDSAGTEAYGNSVGGTTSFADPGIYILTFSVTDKDGGTDSDTVSVEVVNQAPDCTNAAPSIDEIWAPNHKFVEIAVLGVNDADGDAVTITITGIFQDEPLDTMGDGSTEVDGQGVDMSTAEIRTECAGTTKMPGGTVGCMRFTTRRQTALPPVKARSW